MTESSVAESMKGPWWRQVKKARQETSKVEWIFEGQVGGGPGGGGGGGNGRGVWVASAILG